MEIQITGRHVVVPDEVRGYLQEKAARLLRFYDRIHRVEAVLDHEADTFTVELIVHADSKQVYVVREAGPDTFALIDLLVDKLERQLKRHKERKREHKHGSKPGAAEEP